jgi:hypothetical protein
LAGVSVQKSSTGSIERLVIQRNVIGNWSSQKAGILLVGAKWASVRNNTFKRGDTANPSPIVVDSSSCGVIVDGNERLYSRDDAWTEPTTLPCSAQ